MDIASAPCDYTKMKNANLLGPALVIIWLTACATTPQEPLEIVLAGATDGSCSVKVGDEVVNGEQLFQKLKERPRNQQVTLRGMDVNVPYRCIGLTIYALQRARVKMKVGFISEPPPAN